MRLIKRNATPAPNTENIITPSLLFDAVGLVMDGELNDRDKYVHNDKYGHIYYGVHGMYGEAGGTVYAAEVHEYMSLDDGHKVSVIIVYELDDNGNPVNGTAFAQEYKGENGIMCSKRINGKQYSFNGHNANFLYTTFDDAVNAIK